MGSYEYSLSDVPEDTREEIKRCVETILSTRAGTQPVDREFGISWECMDQLPEVAKNRFIIEATEKIEKYEPRVRVKRIEFSYTKEGVLIPKIYLTGR